MKYQYLLILLALALFCFNACKKDQLSVDGEKEFKEVGHVAMDAYDGGWRVTLRPDGVADILPGGDIVYRGTYKISGDKLKIKTTDGETFEFKILSETEIKEKEYGTLLRWETDQL